jgi:hypothetical protein
MDRDQIEEVIYEFAKIMKCKKIKTCNELIEKLNNMKDEDAIDYLVSLARNLINSNKLKIEDIYSNMNLITSLSKEYPTRESLTSKLILLENKKNH